jgi:hypothetical protein
LHGRIDSQVRTEPRKRVFLLSRRKVHLERWHIYMWSTYGAQLDVNDTCACLLGGLGQGSRLSR